MKKRILFVDDDSFLLAGLRRLLRSCRKEWEMQFVDSGEKALALLQEQTVDVIVTDMRMPEMDGAQLLERVRELYPETVRLILSGQCEEEIVYRTIGPAHQYLGKPCNSEDLKSAIKRACTIREHLASEPIHNLIVGFGDLPSLPDHVTKLLQILQDPDADVTDVSRTISDDPELMRRVLQIVNSRFIDLRHRVNNPSDAATALGIDQLRPVVLAASCFAQFQIPDRSTFSMDSIILDGIEVAQYAQTITRAHGNRDEMLDHVKVAALLHGIGKMLIVDRIPDRYDETFQKLSQSGEPPWEIESEAYGATCGDIGAYLLSVWGFPAPVVEAVAFHQQPRKIETHDFTPLTALHVATTWLRNGQPGGSDGLDQDYLEMANVKDKLSQWEEAALCFEVVAAC